MKIFHSYFCLEESGNFLIKGRIYPLNFSNRNIKVGFLSTHLILLLDFNFENLLIAQRNDLVAAEGENDTRIDSYKKNLPEL